MGIAAAGLTARTTKSFSPARTRTLDQSQRDSDHASRLTRLLASAPTRAISNADSPRRAASLLTTVCATAAATRPRAKAITACSFFDMYVTSFLR